MRTYGQAGARGALAAALISLAPPAAAVPASFTDLGVIGVPGKFVFDTAVSLNGTNGSGADTERAIWTDAGTLLAADDHGGPGLTSQIVITLPAGVFFIGINEFDSIFEDDFINSGSGVEDQEELSIVLNIDGVEAATASLIGQAGLTATEETAFFRAEVRESDAVVPLPATRPLMLAGLGLLRRRQAG